MNPLDCIVGSAVCTRKVCNSADLKCDRMNSVCTELIELCFSFNWTISQLVLLKFARMLLFTNC